MKYELTQVPQALFDSEMLMRNPKKSLLSKHLKGRTCVMQMKCPSWLVLDSLLAVLQNEKHGCI